MRQRFVAGVGCPKTPVSVCQRRIARPIVPNPSAASCNLPEAIIKRRSTSATTSTTMFLIGDDTALLAMLGE